MTDPSPLDPTDPTGDEPTGDEPSGNPAGPLSERRLHRHFHEIGRSLPPEVLLGPGDDMAMVEHRGPVLVAADQVVLGRHVRLDESPWAIGRKAVLRNLSDVAAMAARPFAIVATATLGPECDDQWARRLHDGLNETALQWGAPLVGGDLATHSIPEGPTVVSVTILARPGLPDDRVVTRTGARVGDLLVTTGRLGGSLDPDGGGRHLDFTPRIEEAIELAGLLGSDLVSMMDLSDGLAQDAGRLALAADSVARLDASAIPTNPGCDWRRAATDGEDYELLLACRIPPPAQVRGVPVTVIGRLEAPNEEPGQGRGHEPAGAVMVVDGRNRHRIDHLGWEHRRTP